MPFYKELLEKYPHTLLQASGECVGLPSGVMGNSNVGHLCMGAGRVVRTDLEYINHEVRTGAFFQNLVLNAAIDNAVKHDRALHIMGLTSDGMVHSSQEHAFTLLRMAKDREVRRVYVHCFLDGRERHPSADNTSRLCRARVATSALVRLLRWSGVLRDGSRQTLGAN